MACPGEKSSSVSLRVVLDRALVARLDETASREGTTREALLRRLLQRALDEEAAEEAALAAAAEAAYHDPQNQGRIPWEQVKAESRALP